MLKTPLFWALLCTNPSWLPVSRDTGQQSAGWSCRHGGPQVTVCTSTSSVPLPCQGTGQEFHHPPGHCSVTRRTQLWWKHDHLKNGKYDTLGNSGWYELNGGLETSVVSEIPINRCGVCSVWEPRPQSMAWEQHVVIPYKWAVQTYSATEQGCGREGKLIPPPCGYSKNSRFWRNFFSPIFLVHQFTSICSHANILPQLK